MGAAARYLLVLYFLFVHVENALIAAEPRRMEKESSAPVTTRTIGLASHRPGRSRGGRGCGGDEAVFPEKPGRNKPMKRPRASRSGFTDHLR